MHYIHHSQPTISKDNINSMNIVLTSGNIAKGNQNKKFEDQFNKYIGGIKCKLTNSGRSALFLILQTLSLKCDDEVILPTYVCNSVLNTILLIGAIPKIVDVGNDYCLNEKIILESISHKTKAIIVVHTFGNTAEIIHLKDILKNKNIFLIEDCAHAVGGSYDEKKLGSFGDFSFFSFQATKMITSGEGGAVILNNADFLTRFEKNIQLFDKLFALSDLNASLLISQMESLDSFIAKRRELAKIYLEELSSHNKIHIPITDLDKSIFYRFIVNVKNIDFNLLRIKMDKNSIAIRKGVDTLLHPQSLNSNYQNAENLFIQTISLPIYPSLNKEHILYISNIFKGLLDEL